MFELVATSVAGGVYPARLIFRAARYRRDSRRLHQLDGDAASMRGERCDVSFVAGWFAGRLQNPNPAECHQVPNLLLATHHDRGIAGVVGWTIERADVHNSALSGTQLGRFWVVYRSETSELCTVDRHVVYRHASTTSQEVCTRPPVECTTAQVRPRRAADRQ